MIGLIGKKIGMTQVFDERGVLSPVTVVKIEENYVIGERKKEKNGYDAVVLGAVDKKKNVRKPVGGQFPEGVEAKKIIKEIRDFDMEYSVGQKFGVEVFKNIEYVDVTGISKGKGFQGVMKRYNFSGGNKTHGSKFHRGIGSTGMAAAPSRVLKGTRMAGKMGNSKVTSQNLEIVKIDEEKRVIMVRGAVPGTKNSIVLVKRSIKM